MALKGFERRLERMVEGTFARIFRSGLRPVELGRRLVREMDDGRSVDVRGRTMVPNHFTVELGAEDLERFAEVRESLERELAEAAREHARDEGYVFMGPVEVELIEGDGQRTGAFQITGRMREGKGGVGAGSLLLPTGERIALRDATITIGRRPESTLVLADPNVSRNHAEIRPHGNGWILVDLGSTNGSRVNGVRVSSQELQEGDDIAFGNTHLSFEAS
ncbi:MAG: hypothetical protein JWN46_1936 [Acidimicrobiales bacterium]|nr:hypothetical protein [Acidimicrobiales bacterium]